MVPAAVKSIELAPLLIVKSSLAAVKSAAGVAKGSSKVNLILSPAEG